MKKPFLLLFCAVILLALANISSANEMWNSTDYSGSIATGGTFQTVSLPTTRRAIDFQNICQVSGNCTSTSNVCYLYFGSGSATTANSIVIQAGQGYLRSSGIIPADTVKVTCTGTGDKFYLKVN